MRLVIDTDVIVAGMRSPGGASAALLVLLLERRATMLLSVALAFEYETTCMGAEHLLAAQANEADVSRLIDAIIEVSEPVEVHYQWRPLLSDAGDELVLEAAANGRADAIVTFNRRDYGTAPGRFGIEVLTPAEAFRRIRE
ncbi:MAG TPA: putative toxin-antitoxin system toxin component, PIN family [Acetobacteraceae bacterium]|jgi:putative PIN family toxin of toxin-antitoxin system|nr:putative toxin-antitoxin system toxin component, PIN family [Acetobacteraceae bacterium]